MNKEQIRDSIAKLERQKEELDTRIRKAQKMLSLKLLKEN